MTTAVAERTASKEAANLGEVAGLPESAAMELFKFRTGSNIRRSMTALLRHLRELSSA